MKKMLNKKSGFTLIEIIVVLIILGVLAAIALPNLFSNINKSKGAEALAAISSYKANMVGCCTAKTSCVTCSAPSIPAGGVVAGAWFYELAPSTVAHGAATGAGTWTGVGDANGWIIRASLGSAADVNNHIVVSVTGGPTNTPVCASYGTFAGIC